MQQCPAPSTALPGLLPPIALWGFHGIFSSAVFSMHFQVTLLQRGWIHVRKVVYLGQECGIAWKPKGTATEQGSNGKMQSFSCRNFCLCLCKNSDPKLWLPSSLVLGTWDNDHSLWEVDGFFRQLLSYILQHSQAGPNFPGLCQLLRVS